MATDEEPTINWVGWFLFLVVIGALLFVAAKARHEGEQPPLADAPSPTSITSTV